MRSLRQTCLALVTGSTTRPLRRFSMAMALALGVLASPLQAITVTATHDAVDADLGDGACGDSTGQCTLRAAIQHANVTPGPDVIVLTPGYYLLSIPGESEDDGAEGDLDITDSVGLVGLPGQGTTIDGNGLDRVFDIFNGAEAIITDLIVTGGGSGAPGGTEGGGIYINDGELDLRNSQVTGNTGRRAGIEASFTTSVKIEDSVISHNRAVSGTNVYRTAGIYVGSPLGEVTIKRSTIARNVCGAGTSACDSGVVFQFCDPWTPHLENVTIAENTAGVTTHACNLSIENGTLVGSTDESGLNFGTTEGWETVTVTNTILAHNWKDCRADDLNIAGGGNLDSDDSCGLSLMAGDWPATEPQLHPLGFYRSATPVLHPKVGSRAIDWGKLAGCSSEDQHGYTRPQNGDGQGGFECDIGSVEVLRCDGVDLLEIADEVPLAAGSHEACVTLSAVRSEVAAGTTVDFAAREAIALGEGFRVASGGTFTGSLTRNAGSGL